MSPLMDVRPGGMGVSRVAAAVSAVALTWWAMGLATAATPLEEREELTEVCAYGPPQADGEDSEEHRDYHNHRRHLVHEVYETPLPALGEGLMEYDRVTGLLTISGFRTYQPHAGAPAIRFRNECILSFEFDKEKAHDLMAQLRMGTVEVQIGYQLAARRDYDVDYCSGDGDEGARALKVDLLYARLVDTERTHSDGRRIIDTYHTSLGHRAAVQRSMKIVDSVTQAVPEVEISDLQWRPRGGSWGDDFGESGPPESLAQLEREFAGRLERALYPCYVGALSRNAALQGAMVLEIPFGAAGSGAPEFLMDTIENAAIRECVDEGVEAAMDTVSGGDYDEVDAFKATVLMRRR